MKKFILYTGFSTTTAMIFGLTTGLTIMHWQWWVIFLPINTAVIVYLTYDQSSSGGEQE